MPKDYYEHASYRAKSAEVSGFLISLHKRAIALEFLQAALLESIKSNQVKRGESPPRISKRAQSMIEELQDDAVVANQSVVTGMALLESDESLLRVALMTEREQLRLDTSMRDVYHPDDHAVIDQIIDHHRTTIEAIESFMRHREWSND